MLTIEQLEDLIEAAVPSVSEVLAGVASVREAGTQA